MNTLTSILKMKFVALIFSVVLLIMGKASLGQEKTERYQIAWPEKYRWKIVGQDNDSVSTTVYMIPGYENLKNATLLGKMAGFYALNLGSSSNIIDHYKRRTDIGTVLTNIDSGNNDGHPWAIFKVETPKTSKYPIPEAGLYFVIQGDYGVYENYVSIKQDKLPGMFVSEWSNTFKNGKLVLATGQKQ